MAEYEHLPLVRLQGELARKKRPGFGGGVNRNPADHGPKISNEVSEVIAAYDALPDIGGIDPALILRVNLSSIVDEASWERLGLTVLVEDADRAVILFASDTELKEFRARIAAYQGPIPDGQIHPSFAGLLEAIESVGNIEPSDRIGVKLKSLGFLGLENFVDEELYTLDVELHSPPIHETIEQFIFRLQAAIEPSGGEINNTYLGEHIVLCRVRVPGISLDSILKLPEVSRVDLPPVPDLQTEDISELNVEEIVPGVLIPGEGPAVGVVDSGVNNGHPLLEYVVSSSNSAYDPWGGEDAQGHGTSVTSIAAYGDIGTRVEEQDFDTSIRVASMRVVDNNGHFPSDVTVPRLIDDAIRMLHEEHDCRIINISLGDPNLVFSDGQPDPWTALIDELARELDVLIVVSSGNRSNLNASFGANIAESYPEFLTTPDSRIIEPANAAIALTVGAIAHSNGLDEDDAELAGVWPVCANNEPSPFTRTGPGVRGMIKPDLVDLGGTVVWDGPTNSIIAGDKKVSAGIWAFHHQPVTRLFRARSGTSFAAPIVAHKAASILEEFPDKSANFLRSIMALSSNIPEETKDRLEHFDANALRMVCGNGQVDLDWALSSDDNRVVFFKEDEIELDTFAVYEIPIPDLFQVTNGERSIKVSLAFDPPVRRTRADYLGVQMGWRLIRGANSQAVFDQFRKWESAEGDPPEFPPRFVCETQPKPTLREKGTLQCAEYTGKRSIQHYGDKYHVAVWSRRRWAPEAIRSQRFAVTVQLKHTADIQIYQELEQIVRVRV